MRTIHKYTLPPHAGQVSVEMPADPEFLSVQVQRDEPVVWALVDPDTRERQHVTILCLLTGGDVPDGTPYRAERANYLGSVQLDEGFFVLHYFACMGGKFVRP